MKNLNLKEKNIKIHRNLWKVYTGSLAIALCVLAFKGFN